MPISAPIETEGFDPEVLLGVESVNDLIEDLVRPSNVRGEMLLVGEGSLVR